MKNKKGTNLFLLEQKKEQKGTNLFQKEQKRNKNHLKIIFTISYMSKYYCSHCDYDAKIKGNYDKHLKTKKHQDKVKCYPNVIQSYPLLSKCYPNVIQNKQTPIKHGNECKYCGKIYKYRSGLSKHIKYTCKKNKDEDFKELA